MTLSLRRIATDTPLWTAAEVPGTGLQQGWPWVNYG